MNKKMKRSFLNKKMKKIILFFCLLIFFSALFFFLGKNYQQKKLERMRNQFFNRNFQISTQRPNEKIKRERGALNFQMGRIVLTMKKQ
jgi:hypothetical protein